MKRKKKTKKKSPDAVRMGRKGGRARAKSLSSKQLSKIGRLGALEKWRRYYERQDGDLT